MTQSAAFWGGLAHTLAFRPCGARDLWGPLPCCARAWTVGLWGRRPLGSAASLAQWGRARGRVGPGPSQERRCGTYFFVGPGPSAGRRHRPALRRVFEHGSAGGLDWDGLCCARRVACDPPEDPRFGDSRCGSPSIVPRVRSDVGATTPREGGAWVSGDSGTLGNELAPTQSTTSSTRRRRASV